MKTTLRTIRKTRLAVEELEPRMLMTAGSEGIEALLDPGQATHVAIHNGVWSQASTWQNGVIPTDDHAKVLIRPGISVLYDAGASPNLAWIRDEGALTFADTKDESLLVETIYVTPTGSFDIGTAANPFVHHATVTFADNGPLDLTIDPNQVGRGLVSKGHFAVYGQHIDSFALTSVNPLAGATTITIASSLDWHVGDRILLTGTVPGAYQDEEARIVAIAGGTGNTTLTLDHPLQYDHATGWDEIQPYVADETRTITFTSENTTDFTRFGYMMFQVSPDVTINYAAITHMGRTNKAVPIDDLQNFSQFSLTNEPGGGTNVSDRYALFICRAGGNDPSSTPIQIVGNFLTDSPGWGYVNRSANVDFTDNVSYNVDGAAFVTVTGREIGSFTHNLAVYESGGRTEGDPNDSIAVRENLADWGWGGVGFSLAAGGVDLVNNVACGAAFEAYTYVGFLITESGALGAAQYPTSALRDPSIANGETTIDADKVPIHMFYGNEAFASQFGFRTYFFRPIVTETGPNVIDHFLVWNTNVGICLDYTNDVTIRDSRLVSGLSGSVGILQNFDALNLTVENTDVSGFCIGLNASTEGKIVVSGGNWGNSIDIILVNATDEFTPLSDRTVIINNVNFENDQGTWVEYDLSTSESSDCLSSQGTITIDRKTLYAPQQAADYIPFPDYAPDGVPAEYVGLTNQQLMDLYGVCVGGAIAPPDAVMSDHIVGLLGP